MAARNEGSSYYISSLLQKLRSSSSSSVKKAFISLSRATQKSENVVKLRTEGGIKILLEFIKSTNRKVVDISLSVLANCALEKQSRVEIQNFNGLTILCDVLTSCNEISIRSRVSRALANLSLDFVIAKEIFKLGGVAKLLEIAKETADPHLLQSVFRALRIMGRTSGGIRELADNSAVLFFAEVLRSENSPYVQSHCLQTLVELTKVDSKTIGEQLQCHNAIEVICQISYSDNDDLKDKSIQILTTVTKHSLLRVSVGLMGGIEAFIHQIQLQYPQNLVLSCVEGMCMCCREAVNRNKVRSCGGLELLLGLLSQPDYSTVCENILGAFVCFTYDELALKRLLSRGLIANLVSLLRKLLFPQKKMQTLEKEDNELQKNEDTLCDVPQSNISLPSAPSLKEERTMFSCCSESTSLSPAKSPEMNYPLSFSPTSSLSPSCSPELRVSYMSPFSPQFSEDGRCSPMVFSPSGSEVEDDSTSECSRGDVEKDLSVETEGSNLDRDVLLTPAKPGNDVLATTPWNISGYTNKRKVATEDFPSSSRQEMQSSKEMQSCKKMRIMTGITDVDSGQRSTGEMSEYESENFIPHAKKTKLASLCLGTSHNDHLKMFLPNENLFSADQPSARRELLRPAARNSRGSYESMSRGLASDSSSRNTSDVQDSSPQSPSYAGALPGLESKIIFLLSRIGQMPDLADSERLTSPDCIQTVLDYLCLSENPDARCARLLKRIICDRSKFDTLVLIMLPGAIYRQLICGFHPGYLLFNDPSGGGGTQLEELSSKVKFSPRKTMNIGQSLLSVLTTLACTSFGEGVLAHLLLRGTESQRRACALSLPYLCKSIEMKRKLLVDYNGILVILSALSDLKERADVVRAIDSLVYLSSHSASGIDLNIEVFFGKSMPGEGKAIKTGNDEREVSSSPGVDSSANKVVSTSVDGDKRDSALPCASENKGKMASDVALTWDSSRMAGDRPTSCLRSEVARENDSLMTSSHNRPLTQATYLAYENRKSSLDSLDKPREDCRDILDPFSKAQAVEEERVSCELQSVGGCCHYEGSVSTPFDVALILDNGESIGAHRSILCDLSDVFSAMLSSDYVEAKQPEVLIKHLCFNTLSFLVHFAYGCSWSFEPGSDALVCPWLRRYLTCESTLPHVPSHRCHLNYEFVLDVLACADRFLICGLKEQCAQAVMWSVNTWERVADGYLAGACYNSTELCVYCLRYIFRENVELCDVYKCVIKLLESEERGCVMEDLKNMALDCCK